MKKLSYSLSSVGLVSLLVLGTSVGDSHAETKKSPVRGVWSFSQFVPATTVLGTPEPIPTASAGTLFMDEDNNFTGHAVLNTPLGAALEVDFNGRCTFRGEAKNGMDCTLDVPAFGLSDIGRFCVVMERGGGGCFNEFRCVNTNEPGTVLLVEFRRQHANSCR